MASCPNCRADDLAGAANCPRCGRPVPAAEAGPDPEAESILNPAGTPADSRFVASQPAATRSLRPVRAAATLHDAPRVSAPETPAPAHAQTPAPIPAPRPRLVVLRGLRVNAEYPIYEGRNTIGRFADRPVDIDLVSQEDEGQVWCSRQHAAVVYDKGVVLVEDLNSLNGTWVNGTRVQAGQPRQLKPGDVVQVGTVQMRLVVG